MFIYQKSNSANSSDKDYHWSLNDLNQQIQGLGVYDVTTLIVFILPGFTQKSVIKVPIPHTFMGEVLSHLLYIISC